MKTILVIFLVFSGLLFCIAAYLAINKVHGWGWFLFAAIILSDVSYKETNSNDKPQQP